LGQLARVIANPWSPFEGRKIQARVVRTLLRGQTVYANGEIRVGAGFGRFLSGQDDYALAPGELGTRP
jgi:hypothetical protein